MMKFKIISRLAGFVVVILLVALANPAPAAAAIDMSGVYEAIEFSCQFTFVQTGTALQVTGSCNENPLSATGTIDPLTGAYTITGEITGLCANFVQTGTGDGEMFNATYICDAGSGPVTGTKCLNGVIDPGEECQDGNAVDGDCCSSRCLLEPQGSTCTSDANTCTDDVCDGAGTCMHVPNTVSCDDGNACTAGDVCAGGTCVSGPPAPPGACDRAQRCEGTVARMLAACITRVGAQMKRCYLEHGAACLPGEPHTADVLAAVDAKIRARCPDAATIQAIGYGASATPATVSARVQEACTGEVAAIGARTFGGPQGALLSGADAATVHCLSRASSEALRLIKREASLRAACIAKDHGLGEPCEVGRTNSNIATVESTTSAMIDASCPNLKATTGLDAATYVARAGAQARCVTAAGHGNSGPLALDCGPHPALSVPPRGTWTQVILDEASYGTRCADGSPYAFWLRLPPTGAPSEKVAVDLQGGALCIFESDCALVSPANRSATYYDLPPTTGIFSTDAAVNPFSNWTMVYLPYCTQDLHIGGGITDVFPSVTVHRFGAINVRAALRYVRDVLWQDLGATEPEGYRPDRLTVLFGGESSGGTGVNYNYHYLLDDLRWVHTTAAPDSGFALDNGQPLGVLGLSLIVQGETGNLAWGARPYQPPYCLDSSCAVTSILQAATAPRLKAVPEQQILNIASNQADDVQASTNIFPSIAAWINALRTAYCANQGLNGIRNWLPAQSTPSHTLLTNAARWPSVTAAGETLPMFLAGAIADPDAVTDHVDEGTLVTDYPGVTPIGCLE